MSATSEAQSIIQGLRDGDVIIDQEDMDAFTLDLIDMAEFFLGFHPAKMLSFLSEVTVGQDE